MSKLIGWAVMNYENHIDSYYTDMNGAIARAKGLAQTYPHSDVTIVEMTAVKKITATRGEWTYEEEEVI